jgi:hypothetical protein
MNVDVIDDVDIIVAMETSVTSTVSLRTFGY